MRLIPLAIVALACLNSVAKAQRVEDAVAYVRVGITDPMTMARRQLTRGSGFLIDKRGYILSARHVVLNKENDVKGDRWITVALRDPNATAYPAEIVACEQGNIDICLIKISDAAVANANIAEIFKPACRHLAPGESITAYGYPFGDGNPVIRVPGEVTGNLATGLKYPSNVQIIPGMSGGPVVDANGRTVAMNAAGAEGVYTMTFLQPLLHGKSLIMRSGIACEEVRDERPPQTACVDRVLRINKIQLSQNEATPSERDYSEVIPPDTGCRIVSVHPKINSENNANYQFNVGPDGTAVLVKYSLTSGPFFDRYRAWLDMELTIKQVPKP